MLATVTQRLIQFDKIAVLTDLEDDAESMLLYAASLARWYGSKLMIVHACAPEVPAYLPPEPLPNWPADGARLKDYAEEKINNLSAKLGLQDVSPKLIVRESGMTHILQELAEYHPNLLILASHGREGIRKWLLGSVAEGVFRNVPWPVLVLGPRFDREQAMRQMQFRKLVYATDLSGGSVTALQHAAGIAHDHDAELIVLYVESNPRRSFTFDRVISLQRLEDWMHDCIDGLADALNGAECMVEFGKPASTIVEAAKIHQADLLVLGARGLGVLAGAASHFVGGTAYEVVCSAPCPVLIVPQPR